jgi:hypothetical protein
MILSLPAHRFIRVITVGITAAVCLYALLIVLAEPMRGFAASDSENVVVSLTVAADIANSCTTPVALGTITRTGDTGLYSDSRATTCTITTNNTTGYTLSWLISTGTGAAGARTGTGYLNGFTSGNRVAPFGTGSTVAAMQPIPMSVTNDARWAGRLSAASTTTGGAGKDWGADTGVTGTEKWLRVGTGSAVNISTRTTQTSVAGDVQKVGFRAIINGTAIVPTDTYKATVIFTATTN